MSVDVSKAVCQQLMESSTATLTSVLRLHGLKNTFMHGVAPLGPGMKMAGPAFTLRYIPAREDLDEIPMDNLKDVQRVGIEQVPDGAVFVIDARGQTSAGTDRVYPRQTTPGARRGRHCHRRSLSRYADYCRQWAARLRGGHECPYQQDHPSSQRNSGRCFLR